MVTVTFPDYLIRALPITSVEHLGTHLRIVNPVVPAILNHPQNVPKTVTAIPKTTTKR